MESYYDNDLISYLKTIGIKDYKIIPQTDDIVELIMKNFNFKYGRVDFTGFKNEKYKESDSSNLATDVVSFINKLIQENICDTSEKIIFIGDDLTKYGYEFYLYDLLKVISYLVNDIPQHHYFLFEDGTKLLFVSFENQIQFGMKW